MSVSVKTLLLPGLLVLAACGTPQQNCIRQNTQDLRTVEKLIAESERNLARGYGVEKETVIVSTMRPCYFPGRPTKDNPNPAPVLRYCDRDVAQTVNRPVSIDLDAEAVKLRQLKDKRALLARQAQSVVAQCQAIYPE